MTTSVGKPFVDVKFDELMDREERDFKKGGESYFPTCNLFTF